MKIALPNMRNPIAGRYVKTGENIGGMRVHYSSRTEEWGTPQRTFDALNAEFGFTLDPCSTHENAKCARHFTRAEDGLRQDWRDEIVFMNPPYGRPIGLWMQKAYESTRNGATVVCLIPARTDARWWHRFAMKGEIRLFKGRLKFEGGKHCAPFPSCVVVFRPSRFALIGCSQPTP
jgi:site-specific DNA-methyltransferase (adenine-specific)